MALYVILQLLLYAHPVIGSLLGHDSDLGLNPTSLIADCFTSLVCAGMRRAHTLSNIFFKWLQDLNSALFVRLACALLIQRSLLLSGC